MDIRQLSLIDVRDYIVDNHYSKSVNGVKVSYVFGAFIGDRLVACVLYGSLSTTAWKKYSENESDVIELRRLVSTQTNDRNFLSKFVSKTIRYLKANTNLKFIVSYADPFYGHTGYIYQALNFEYRGLTNPDILLETPEGKRYHSRSLRVKYKGKLKPFAEKLNQMSKEGLLKTVEIPSKHIYVYPLRSTPALTTYPKGIK